MEADVGVCHSFGGALLYMHPLLCPCSLQQSYSSELPESCPCLSLQPTQQGHHSPGSLWATTKPPTIVTESFGEVQQTTNNFVYVSPKHFCHLMLRLVLISLHFTKLYQSVKLAVFGCPRTVVAMGW